MSALRVVVVVFSLGQIAAGLACLLRAKGEATGQFGFAVCLTVGSLGLIGQATWFLREVAIVANVLLALVFLPSLLNVILSFIEPPPGPPLSPVIVLITAAIVGTGVVSARALWKIALKSKTSSVGRSLN